MPLLAKHQRVSDRPCVAPPMRSVRTPQETTGVWTYMQEIQTISEPSEPERHNSDRQTLPELPGLKADVNIKLQI